MIEESLGLFPCALSPKKSFREKRKMKASVLQHIHTEKVKTWQKWYPLPRMEAGQQKESFFNRPF